MKTTLLRLVSLLLLCLTTTLTRADDPVPGIQFFKGSWKELLAEAKKQNKPIFVDVYTTWCGPCKLMAKEAFPDKAVGEKFNANFVSYQIDAEKGEGITVAKQYAVTAYPTTLYVSASGDLVHRSIGYGGIKGLLAEADKAITAAKDPVPLSMMEKEYAAGKREVAFLRELLTKRATVGMPFPEATEVFIATLPEAERMNPDNLKAIGGNLTTTKGAAFELILNALETKVLKRPDYPMVQAMFGAISNDQKNATDEAAFEKIMATQRRMMLGALRTPMTTEAKVDESLDQSRMQYFKRTQNLPKYRAIATKQANTLLAISADSLTKLDQAGLARFEERTKNVPDSVKRTERFQKTLKQMQAAGRMEMASSLNNLAWGYFQTLNDPADLKQALAWSGRSLELHRQSAFLDTYANLLHKLGRKSEAITHQEEAIALAKTNGEDTANMEKTLAGMRK
jgi:thiol-disulfide isomerase/thioredoxin